MSMDEVPLFPETYGGDAEIRAGGVLAWLAAHPARPLKARSAKLAPNAERTLNTGAPPGRDKTMGLEASD